MDKDLRREIMLDNYQNPFHKYEGDKSFDKYRTNNESCIDDLTIYFKVKDGILIDICFDGEACAISTSATSIMLRRLIGKSFSEIRCIVDNYKKMINEEEYDKTILEELNVYDEIYLQPNRKTCALLPVKAIEEMLRDEDKWK